MYIVIKQNPSHFESCGNNIGAQQTKIFVLVLRYGVACRMDLDQFYRNLRFTIPARITLLQYATYVLQYWFASTPARRPVR